MTGADRAFSPGLGAALILCALFPLLLISCQVTDRAARVAFVYGISIYQPLYGEGDNRSFNLQYCDDDAASMADLLESSGYTVHRRITGDASPSGADALPTRERMQADLASVTADTDRVLFYYSGHGFRDSSGTDYIVPFGGLSASGSLVMSNMVTAAEFRSWLASCPAAQKLCILDSCYSGGFVSVLGELDLNAPIFGPNDAYGATPALGIADPRLISPLLVRFMAESSDGSGAIVLSAAGSEELSYESADTGHGIFSKALLDSVLPEQGSSGTMARADADSDGVISVIEAFAYAAQTVESSWNEGSGGDGYELGQYADFFPHVSGGSLDSILFSY